MGWQRYAKLKLQRELPSWNSFEKIPNKYTEWHEIRRCPTTVKLGEAWKSWNSFCNKVAPGNSEWARKGNSPGKKCGHRSVLLRWHLTLHESISSPRKTPSPCMCLTRLPFPLGPDISCPIGILINMAYLGVGKMHKNCSSLSFLG